MRKQQPYQQHRSQTQHLAAFSGRAPTDTEMACTQRKGAASCGVFLEQNCCIDSSLGTSWMLGSGSKVSVSWRGHCWVHRDNCRVHLDSSPSCENKALSRKVTTGGRHAEEDTPSWAQHRWHCGTREKVYQNATLPSHLGGSRQSSKALKRIWCCSQKNSAYSEDGHNQWHRKVHLLHRRTMWNKYIQFVA